MRSRILAIVSEVLRIPVEQITEESSPDNIKTWDSLNHVQIILSLEDEFGISLDGEEIIEMQSVGRILEIVAKKKNGRPLGEKRE
jgi:acyl carrier protein